MINDNLQYLLKTPIDRKFKGVKENKILFNCLFVCLFIYFCFCSSISFLITHYLLPLNENQSLLYSFVLFSSLLFLINFISLIMI